MSNPKLHPSVDISTFECRDCEPIAYAMCATGGYGVGSKAFSGSTSPD